MNSINGIDLSNVFFHYDAHPDVPVLHDFSASIPSNRIVALVGRSGSGKSTILKLICGLLSAKPTTAVGSSSIKIGGKLPHEARSTHLIGYLPQECNPVPWRTAVGNLRLALEMAGRKDSAVSMAAAMLDRLGLSELANRYPHRLSGGQRRRIAIAMTLVCGPNYVLLDEPFSGVDAITRYELYNFLLSVWSQRAADGPWAPRNSNQGHAMILVTHDLEEAALLADIILVLKGCPLREPHSITNHIAERRTPDDLESLKFDPEFRTVVEEIRNNL